MGISAGLVMVVGVIWLRRGGVIEVRGKGYVLMMVKG